MKIFKYINQSSCINQPTIDDEGNWKEVIDSFNVLGINKSE